ncbi:MAG: diguanylate cyclase [Anaerolineales bacterium]|nr:diguanylate cyclase [Anaerolineales bacterium]
MNELDSFNEDPQSTRDLISLLESITAISSKLEVEQVAYEAARQIAAYLHADFCGISHWDVENNLARPFVHYAKDANTVQFEYLEPYDLNDYPLSLWVLQSSQVAQVHLDDPEGDAAEKQFLEEVGSCTVFLLPLFAQDEKIGLIEVYDNRRAHVISDEQITRVQVLVKHAGVAIERARSLKEVQQRANELEALRQASLSLIASLDLETVLYAILESALGLMDNALDAHVFLYDGNKATFAAALWADGSRGSPWKEVREHGLTYTVARSGEMIVAPDIEQHPLFQNAPSDWKGAIIGIPLKIRARVVGVMNVAFHVPQAFDPGELRVLSLLADQAALAIENARLHNLTMHQALTDPLTELANRRAFDQRLNEEIRRSNRYQHSFALMMIDVDGFKQINDTYGHPVGDKVLKILSQRMLTISRDTDFLARIGGDEFAMFLPETDIEEARLVAAKLEETILAYAGQWVKGEDVGLSLSIGLASYPEDAQDAETLISKADQDLYADKGE